WKFLYPLADKLLVAASLIMLVQFDMAPAWAVIIIISREFAVTGLRLVASGEGIVLAASQMGKLKTATQLIAIALLLLHNFPLAFLSFPVDLWMLYIATFFTALSGVDYFMKNWHVMKGSMYMEQKRTEFIAVATELLLWQITHTNSQCIFNQLA